MKCVQLINCLHNIHAYRNEAWKKLGRGNNEDCHSINVSMLVYSEYIYIDRKRERTRRKSLIQAVR